MKQDACQEIFLIGVIGAIGVIGKSFFRFQLSTYFLSEVAPPHNLKNQR